MTGQGRQLAAIMYTDIVGYTGMMQYDEPQTVNRLERHREIIDKSVTEHTGKIIQYFGDGSLSLFGSVYEAVLSAIKIQGLLLDESLPLRIGIHVGEVHFINGIAYGDGLNIASRIQSLGLKGAILISKSVYDLIQNQPDIISTHLGTFRLKNVRNPMPVYAILNNGFPIPKKKVINIHHRKSGNKKINSLPRRAFAFFSWFMTLFFFLLFSRGYLKSVLHGNKNNALAILPFININHDPDQDYFCEGITDEIQTQLSDFVKIKFCPETLTLKYKNNLKTIPEIGNDLGVNRILQGSVSRSGNLVRVYVQLIDTKNNRQLWSASFERKEYEIFGLQNEIAGSITQALKTELSGKQQGIGSAGDNPSPIGLYAGITESNAGANHSNGTVPATIAF